MGVHTELCRDPVGVLIFKVGPHGESRLLEVGSLGYLMLEGSGRIVRNPSFSGRLSACSGYSPGTRKMASDPKAHHRKSARSAGVGIGQVSQRLQMR